MPREVPLEIILGAMTARPRDGPAEIDDLLITMASAAGAASQLKEDPAGPAVAAALMTIGERFADIMSAFADAVANRIDFVVEDAQGNA
jgi:hypothetical protein